MPFPSRGEIELALLFEIVAMGGEGKPKDIYPRVTAHFPQITKSDLEKKKLNGTSLWENRIAWVRYQLAENGEIDKSVRGVWRITEKGIERLKKEGLLAKEVSISPISPELKLHQQIQARLEEIGRIFGKYVKKEYHIVTGEKDQKKLDQLLEPHFKGTFHGISTVTVVLSPEEVDELYESLNRFKEILNK